MTDCMFCAKYLSQYQEILSKTRLFGTGKYSKLGRTLIRTDQQFTGRDDVFLFLYIKSLETSLL